jgi:hypothetical protein
MRGGFVVSPKIHNATFIVFPRDKLVAAEGRLSAMFNDNGDDHDLASPSLLPGLAAKLARAFEVVAAPRIGTLQQATAAVRRMDLATELRFHDPSDGLAVLDAASQITAAPLKTVCYRNEGRTETVAFAACSRKTGRVIRIVSRLYDKGVESDTHKPGERLRWETQTRYEKREQMRPEVMADEDIGAMWLKGFKACTGSAERLTVAPADLIEKAVLLAADEGKLSPALAERLAGTLIITRLRGAGWWRDQGLDKTGARRRTELRKAGFATSSALNHAVELGPVVEALAAAWGRPTGDAEESSDELRNKRKREAKTPKAATRRKAA